MIAILYPQKYSHKQWQNGQWQVTYKIKIKWLAFVMLIKLNSVNLIALLAVYFTLIRCTYIY